MKKAMICIILSQLCYGCVASSVGGQNYRENGKAKSSLDYCMGHCLEKADNGESCVKFSAGMASICKRYLAR